MKEAYALNLELPELAPFQTHTLFRRENDA